jgi:hypothetical protein
MRTWAAAFAFAAALTVPSRANENEGRVILRVDPHHAFAPATVQVSVMVELDAAARRLVVEADSGTFYRRTDHELEGSTGARLVVFKWRNLPDGEYMVTATVTRAGGIQDQAKERVTVLP